MMPTVFFVSWMDGMFTVYQGAVSMDGIMKWIDGYVEHMHGRYSSGSGSGSGIGSSYSGSGSGSGSGISSSGCGAGGNQNIFPEAEQAFKSGSIDMSSQQAAMMATMLSAKSANDNDYVTGAKYSHIASNENALDDCGSIQEATLLQPYPTSKDQATSDISNYHEHIDALLDPSKNVDLSWASKADADHITMCVNSHFAHSLFYQPDATTRLSKWIQLIRKTCHDHNYTAPHLRGPTVPSIVKVKLKLV